MHNISLIFNADDRFKKSLFDLLSKIKFCCSGLVVDYPFVHFQWCADIGIEVFAALAWNWLGFTRSLNYIGGVSKLLISPGVFNPAVVSLRLELWREEERKLPMEWGEWHLGCLAKVRIIENRSGTGMLNLELKVRIRNNRIWGYGFLLGRPQCGQCRPRATSPLLHINREWGCGQINKKV